VPAGSIFIFILFLFKTLCVYKTVDTNTQTYTRVTRQGRMALTGVDAQNNAKC